MNICMHERSNLKILSTVIKLYYWAGKNKKSASLYLLGLVIASSTSPAPSPPPPNKSRFKNVLDPPLKTNRGSSTLLPKIYNIHDERRRG